MALGEQHGLLRDSVRKFARERLAPNAAQWDREKHFPRAELKAIAAMGLCGVAIPEEWDGAGMDYTAFSCRGRLTEGTYFRLALPRGLYSRVNPKWGVWMRAPTSELKMTNFS